MYIIYTLEDLKWNKTSLKRWIDRYEKIGSIKRQSRKSISYKITKDQVKYALQLLKQNEQITMEELSKLIKKKYKDFDITSTKNPITKTNWEGKGVKPNIVCKSKDALKCAIEYIN